MPIWLRELNFAQASQNSLGHRFLYFSFKIDKSKLMADTIQYFAEISCTYQLEDGELLGVFKAMTMQIRPKIEEWGFPVFCPFMVRAYLLAQYTYTYTSKNQ